MSQLWPTQRGLDDRLLKTLLANRAALKDTPENWLNQWESVWAPVAVWVAEQKRAIGGVPIIGIQGGQGSGKSTLSKALARLYRDALGWNVVTVSMDDLYLTYAERQHLGQECHPLLVTRGVPGTHDHILGRSLFADLKALEPGAMLRMPTFDKASDDRLPESEWQQVFGPVDLILFEGWCVGCRPVPESELQEPINELERIEDKDGHWRRSVNEQLAGAYREWFDLIDRLLLLRVPSMQAVLNWRSQQEVENRKNQRGATARSMDANALARFIQHYERLTRNALRDLPEHADLVLELNSLHLVKRII